MATDTDLKPKSPLGHRHTVSAGLAACVMGLAVSPLVFVAAGVLNGFGPAFAWITMPPLLLSIAFLLYRFLSIAGQSDVARLGLEAVCWLVIAAFLFLVSGVNLLVRLESAGLCATFFLLSAATCLPLVLIRETALRQRLARIPTRIATSALVFALAVAAGLSLAFLIRPASFV